MTLTAVNTPTHVVSDLRTQYSDRNISITTREMPDEPNRFAILSRQDNFVTAVRLDDIYAGTIDPTDTDTDTDTDAEAAAGNDATTDATVDAIDEDDVDLSDPTTSPAAYSEPVLYHLEEALFTSYSIRQMFMASREIEDRAWRVGSGELHAGFQTLDVLSGQTETYDQLGTQTDLSVHAYAAPVSEPISIPESDGFTLHVEREDEIKKTWFVVYDGDDVDENKCALLAEERGDDEYYGFWTYNPQTVDYLLGYLQSTYGRVESDDSTDNDSVSV